MSAPKTPPKALRMLWAEWRKVAKLAGWSPEDEGMHRDEFTLESLGVEVPRQPVPSWRALKAGQIDRLMAGLKRLQGDLALVETDAGLESYEDAAERRRLVYAVGRDSVAAYGDTPDANQAIATFLGNVDGLLRWSPAGKWPGLPLPELRKLAMHMASNRARKFAKLAAIPPGPTSPF